MAKQKKKDAPVETPEKKPAAVSASVSRVAGPPLSAPPPAAPPSGGDDDDDAVLDLRALVGGTLPPPASAKGATSHDDDDDDAKLDLSAMATSLAPPRVPTLTEAEPVEAKASTAPSSKVSGAKSGDAKPSSRSEAKDAPAAVVAAPAEKPKSTGILIGIAALAVVVVGAFAFLRNGDNAAGAGEVAGATGNEPATIGPLPGTNTPEPAAPTEPAVPVAPTEPAAPTAGSASPVAATPAAPVEPSAPSAAVHPRVGARPAAGAAASAAGANTPAVAAVVQPAAVQAPAAGTRTGRTTPPAAGATPAAGTSGEMNSLLDRALGGSPVAGGTRTGAAGGAVTAPAGGGTARPVAAAAAGPVPNEPGRGDIARGMGALLPGVRACAGDQVGLATATVALKSDGTVVSASVAGVPFGGTPQGACMEGVIRRARFSPFTATTFRFTYPLAIR